MKVWRRISLLSAFLPALVVFYSAVPSSYAESPGTRQVITRETLRSAGVVRLTDVLFLADDWLLHTSNGYTYKASPNGLSTWDEQRWVVLIDGQRADVDLFDAVNLNMVPIGVGQIDSVVITSTPVLHDGVFADAGLIHLYTSRPQRGETAKLSVSGGNETGDQGPYRFTPYGTPNIDSVGPDGSLTFAVGRDNWTVRANTTLQTYYFTDPAVRRRVNTIIGLQNDVPIARPDATLAGPQPAAADVVDVGTYAAYPDMRRITGSLGMSLIGENSQHETFFGYAKATNYFLYSEVIGREIPMDNRYTHAGINGRFGLGPDGGLSYRVQFTNNRMSKQENTLDIDYGWSHRRVLANGEYFYQWDGARIVTGGGYELRSIKSSYLLEDNPNNFGKLFGSVEIAPGDRISNELGATAFFAGGTPSLKASWNSGLRLTDGHAFTTQLVYTQRSFAENGDLWYWTSRGYGFLDENGVTAELPEEINKRNTFLAGLAWRSRLPAGINIGLSGRYYKVADAYLERRAFVYNPDSCSVASPTTIVPGNGGELAGGAIDLSYRFSTRFETRLHYQYLTTLSGDRLFKDKWRAVPDHKASARATYHPVKSFSIWAMLTHYSRAFWKEYEALENTQCERTEYASGYSPHLNAFTTVDVTLRKTLWHERMAVDVAARNLFNREVRYHPVGASFGLGVFMQISLQLHSQ